MRFLLIFKTGLFVHLHLCDVSYRKIKKWISLLPCFKLILFRLMLTFQFIIHEVSCLVSIFHSYICSEALNYSLWFLRMMTSLFFLVFTVLYCWNVTFGTVTVIRHMLILVITSNDIDNAMIMREKGKIGSWGRRFEIPWN